MTHQPFQWPEGKRAALSLTFDDARFSQVEQGIPILDACGVRGTFYVTVARVEQRLGLWCQAVTRGHEIGNHTLTHPCSGNFRCCRDNPLEEFTLAHLEAELSGANEAIERALAIRPRTFAYPCGQKFVGRGQGVASYVPLVAKHFLAGRGFCDEAANDPAFCDLAQLYGVDGDAQTFAQFEPALGKTVAEGGWLILVAHEVADAGGHQTMPSRTLEQLCVYASAAGLWLDSVAAIAHYVQETRRTLGIPY